MGTLSHQNERVFDEYHQLEYGTEQVRIRE